MSAPLRSNWTLGDYAHWFTSAFDDAASDAEIRERIGSGRFLDFLNGIEIHDRREDVRGWKHRRGRHRPPRRWSQIRGVCVHQTASGHLDADHPGLLSVPAHIVVHQDGAVSLLHPLVSRMPHGHALNSETIGIEVDCREYGVEGDRRTFWRSRKEKRKGTPPEKLHKPATARQLFALEKVLDYCRAHLLANGRPCMAYTHRQGHKSRVNDPGERIAKTLRHWAQNSEGAWVPYDETRGSGKPWPEKWRAA